MLNSNRFFFLAKDYAEFFQNCFGLESRKYIDEEGALNKARIAVEDLAKRLVGDYGNAKKTIDMLLHYKKAPLSIVNLMHAVRNPGNDGSHGTFVPYKKAIVAEDNLFEIFLWFVFEYEGCNYPLNWFNDKGIDLVKKYKKTNMMDSEKNLEDVIKLAENKIREAELRAESAVSAKIEAEMLAQKYKEEQVRSLERNKKLVAECEQIKREARELIKKEKDARIKAETNSIKTLDEIATEIAQATAMAEAAAESKANAAIIAAETAKKAAEAKVHAAESEKLAAERSERAADAARIAAIEKTRDAKEESFRMRKLADEAVRYAKKANQDLQVKIGEAEKAYKFAEEAKRRVEAAEIEKCEAEERVEILERQMQLVLDDKNKLQLLIMQKEAEFRDRLNAELKQRDELQLQQLGLIKSRLKEQIEEEYSTKYRNVNRKLQIQIWNNAEKNSDSNDGYNNQVYSFKAHGCKERLESEARLNALEQKRLDSKVISRKIDIKITKVTYARGKFNIDVIARNENNVDVCIEEFDINLHIYNKATGVKIFDSTFNAKKLVINKLDTVKSKFTFGNVRLYDIERSITNKLLNWDMSSIDIKSVRRES